MKTHNPQINKTTGASLNFCEAYRRGLLFEPLGQKDE